MKYPSPCGRLGSSPCLGLHPWHDPSQFLMVLYLLLCTAFNFHFLLEPKLNWVRVSALAMGGVLQKAEASASRQLLQRAAGFGVRGVPVCHHPPPRQPSTASPAVPVPGGLCKLEIPYSPNHCWGQPARGSPPSTESAQP